MSVTKWVDLSFSGASIDSGAVSASGAVDFGWNIAPNAPVSSIGGEAPNLKGPHAAPRPILVVAEDLEGLDSASLGIGRFLELNFEFRDGRLVDWDLEFTWPRRPDGDGGSDEGGGQAASGTGIDTGDLDFFPDFLIF